MSYKCVKHLHIPMRHTLKGAVSTKLGDSDTKSSAYGWFFFQLLELKNISSQVREGSAEKGREGSYSRHELSTNILNYCRQPALLSNLTKPPDGPAKWLSITIPVFSTGKMKLYPKKESNSNGNWMQLEHSTCLAQTRGLYLSQEVIQESCLSRTNPGSTGS